MKIIPKGTAYQLPIEIGQVVGVKNKLSLYFYSSAGLVYFSLWIIFSSVSTDIIEF
mgnify:CR=1 FL=1